MRELLYTELVFPSVFISFRLSLLQIMEEEVQEVAFQIPSPFVYQDPSAYKS